jgi:hypothetical protein
MEHLERIWSEAHERRRLWRSGRRWMRLEVQPTGKNGEQRWQHGEQAPVSLGSERFLHGA